MRSRAMDQSNVGAAVVRRQRRPAYLRRLFHPYRSDIEDAIDYWDSPFYWTSEDLLGRLHTLNSQRSRAARDAELFHFRIERCPFHAEASRRARFAPDNPIRFTQGADDMVAFRILKG